MAGQLGQSRSDEPTRIAGCHLVDVLYASTRRCGTHRDGVSWLVASGPQIYQGAISRVKSKLSQLLFEVSIGKKSRM